jgi:hypothetical protein
MTQRRVAVVGKPVVEELGTVAVAVVEVVGAVQKSYFHQTWKKHQQ